MSPEVAEFFRDQPVFVTGATGFVGWHVADDLGRAGAQIRVLVRPGSETRLEPSGNWNAVRGDLLDRPGLVRALDGCRYLFHVAGDYRFWAREPGAILRNNATGTAQILDAARDAGIERVVVTSTPGILARNGNAIGDESRLADPRLLEGPYKRGKFAAYLETQKRIEAGQWIVAALPTAPIGPRDVKPTPTGAMIVQFLNGRIPFLARTGLNFVDVRNAARGHLQAMVRGVSGERYLLGSENLWLRDFFVRLAMLVAGARAPTRYAPYQLSYAAACCSELWARWSGREPFVTREGVKMSRYPHFFTSEKAIREIGYAPGGIDDAMRDAITYFRARE
jgi:dihydroflavonol-4-reductase